ncbi:MAG: efflux transporter outer membrane subunit [Kiritimatiellae bacterium]|nr:efflux transporter outer membrane subunit [Kiritimatiellia bacterium]
MKLYPIVCTTLLIAGCSSLPSVGPDYKKPEVDIPNFPMPDAGTTDVKGEDKRYIISTNELSAWWTRFDDKTLANLVDTAVSNNLSYKMAFERLTQSRWQVFGSYAAFMPKISANGQAIRSDEALTSNYQDLFKAGFDASWEIDIFGGSRRATESAIAEHEAEGLSLNDAWVSLTAEVGRQYIELRTTQQRIAVARANLKLQSETYDIVKSRLESGIGDELSVSQSKYIVEQTRAAIPPLLAQEERLMNAIAILIGSMPGSCHELLKACPDRDWLVPAGRLAETPLDLIRMRPDVRAAERKLAAQSARIGVAKSMWYPKLFINGELGLKTGEFQDWFKRRSLYGSFGPSISWPIFQGGRIYADIKVEESRTREACLNYELTIQKAFEEVRDMYSTYTREYHRYEALKAAVKAAQEAVTISNDLNKNGLKDFTAVIDAQRSLLTLEESLVASRGNITANLISLYKALGGGLAAE